MKLKIYQNNIKFGNSLGEWEDEMSDGWQIIEIIIGGAKSYSYIKYNPKTNESAAIIKQKGITLDRSCSDIFTFEKIKNMVLNNGEIKSPERFQFVMDENKNVLTRYVSRTVKATLDSKRTIIGNDTYPFGFKFD
jgi:hypothetical protein